MEKQNLPAGNYTAIVVGARVEHYPSGSYIVQLLLSVTQGELKYSKCCKNMFSRYAGAAGVGSITLRPHRR